LDASPLDTVLWALSCPTYAVRWVLIPPSDLYWNRCRRVVSCLAPVGIVAFCAVAYFGGLRALIASPASLCVTGGALVVSVAIFCGSDDGPSVPWFYPGLTLIAKASSILVLSVIAEELTACVETLGLLSGVPRLWLGTTVIAWGNSLGDVVTGIAMVRQGRTRTAFTAVFASPLFNLLCGAGVALALLACHSGGSARLWLSREGMIDLRIHIRFLLSSCFVLGLVLVCYKDCFWVWALALWALYAVFLVCVLFAEHSDGL